MLLKAQQPDRSPTADMEASVQSLNAMSGSEPEPEPDAFDEKKQTTNGKKFFDATPLSKRSPAARKQSTSLDGINERMKKKSWHKNKLRRHN